MKIFVNSAVLRVNRGGCDMRHSWEDEAWTQIVIEKPRKEDNILKWKGTVLKQMLKNYCLTSCTGFSWLNIGPSGGLL